MADFLKDQRGNSSPVDEILSASSRASKILAMFDAKVFLRFFNKAAGPCPHGLRVGLETAQTECLTLERTMVVNSGGTPLSTPLITLNLKNGSDIVQLSYFHWLTSPLALNIYPRQFGASLAIGKSSRTAPATDCRAAVADISHHVANEKNNAWILKFHRHVMLQQQQKNKVVPLWMAMWLLPMGIVCIAESCMLPLRRASERGDDAIEFQTAHHHPRLEKCKLGYVFLFCSMEYQTHGNQSDCSQRHDSNVGHAIQKGSWMPVPQAVCFLIWVLIDVM